MRFPARGADNRRPASAIFPKLKGVKGQSFSSSAAEAKLKRAEQKAEIIRSAARDEAKREATTIRSETTREREQVTRDRAALDRDRDYF